MRGLSTTSYAILSLLAVKPWTTYELAQQMKRSLSAMWPRAESVVYEEPKNLVAHGLATATTEHTGRRPSTRYAITAKGRRHLTKWLAEPGAGGLVVEFEGLLKVAFADHGSLDALRANLAAIRAEAQQRREHFVEQLREYEETSGPFPDRLPIISLVSRFHLDQIEMLDCWAEWAESEVAKWSGVTPETGAAVASGAFDYSSKSASE